MAALNDNEIGICGDTVNAQAIKVASDVCKCVQGQ
jgi:hypothetical protein